FTVWRFFSAIAFFLTRFVLGSNTGGLDTIYYNRLVPVDNSLIFINFMNRQRAKRTDSLTNRFFL
ncbi:MAG: hypothetical protein, partial [Olavius algarvensis Gamma 1 endosymbiont]